MKGLAYCKQRFVRSPFYALKPSIQAFAWAGFTYVGVTILGLVQHFFLAKWLAPEIWAVFGLGLGLTTLLKAMTALELNQALLVSKNSNPNQLTLATIWFTELVRRGLLALGLALTAPIIANFWQTPDLIFVLRMIAIALFLEGLESIRVLEYQKRLAFSRLGIYQLWVKGLATIIAIILVLRLGDIRALVWKYLFEMLLKAIISQLMFPCWPGWFWDRQVFRELWPFAKHIPSIGLAMALATVSGEWIIAWLTDFKTLGAWLLGSTLTMLPFHFTVQAFSVVGLAAFGNHPDAKQKSMPSNLCQALCVYALGLSFLYLAIAVFGHYGLVPLLGSKWQLTADLLPVLATIGFFRCLSQLFTLSFFGLKKPFLEAPIIWTELLFSGTTLAAITWLFSFQIALVITSWVFILGFCGRWYLFRQHFSIAENAVNFKEQA